AEENCKEEMLAFILLAVAQSPCTKHYEKQSFCGSILLFMSNFVLFNPRDQRAFFSVYFS
ncbi:MAG: hypothetical protein QXR06_04795, partial [Candidatus Bathyarchaeia archaeon]